MLIMLVILTRYQTTFKQETQTFQTPEYFKDEQGFKNQFFVLKKLLI